MRYFGPKRARNDGPDPLIGCEEGISVSKSSYLNPFSILSSLIYGYMGLRAIYVLVFRKITNFAPELAPNQEFRPLNGPS